MSDLLHDCHVIVTRPQQQAEGFCRLLESHAATVTRLPLMAIQALPSEPIIERLQQTNLAFSWVIFISSNAVNHSQTLQQALTKQLRNTHYAAIGKATANTMQQLGLSPILQPSQGYNSEALLTLLTDKRLERLAVLIVKGQGGRTHLQQTLCQRGAKVFTASVYKRCTTVDNHHRLMWQQQANKHDTQQIDIIALTSVEVGLNLLTLLPQLINTHSKQYLLLVGSSRIAEQLEHHLNAHTALKGFIKAFIIADNPSDSSMLQALIEWKNIRQTLTRTPQHQS